MFSFATIRPLAFALLLCLSFVSVTFAQSATATLSGTVVDEKGAVVVGATVTATNTATSNKRTVTTNENGQFVLPQLAPSVYTVRVENQGFSPAEVQKLTLNVNDQRTLNIALKVGAVGATVQVTTDAPLVDEQPAAATTIDRQFVQNLPLNGRSFQSLFELTPGVVLTPSGGGGPGQFSVNGQRTNANYVMIDGVGANVSALIGNSLGQTATGSLAGFSASGGTNNLVSVDALQEFTIQTSTYAPEFGRTPGAQISLVTRSGSNQFTGSVFEYFRNEKLDANDWFANRSGFKRAPLRLNNFGGVFGGPLVKDKTFFFFSYEGQRLRQPQSNTFFVPSQALRSSAAPALRPILNAFPVANGPLDTFNGQPTGYATFNASYSDRIRLDATSIRLDHNFTDKINVFGRYNEAPSTSTDRLTNPSTPGTTRVGTRGLTLGSSQTFSSKVVNDLRFNYTRYQATLDLALDDANGAVPFDRAVLAGSGVTATNPTYGFFLIDLTPAFGFRFAPGLFVGQLYNNRNQQFNLVDNFSYQARSHALKFGVDYRRLNPTFGESDYFATYAAFTFASLTANPFGGQNSLVVGRVSQLQITADTGERNPLFHNFSLYAQDTWKATKRLTLTYGLRYELNPAPSERDGKNPIILTNVNSPADIAVAPAGTPLYRTTHNNFAPRFGVAYQLNQKAGWETVVRGGGGIFYDLGGGSAAGSAFSQTFPFVGRKTIQDIAAGFPFPLTAAQAAPPAITSTLPATTEIYGFAPDLVLPRTYQFNFTVEQSLGKNQTISAAYLGARGRELLRQDFIAARSATNPGGVNTNFPSGVVITRNTAESSYDSLQLQFTRRLTSGFQALASYTLSNSEDTASSDITRSAALFIVSPDADRGPSDFDIRHNFTGALTYNIPAPSQHQLAKAIFGGWSTDAIFRYRSAPPVNVVVNNLNLSGVANVTRPNIVAGQAFYLDDSNAPGGKRINPAAFVNPPTGTRGNLGRNALRGFTAKQIDWTLRRDFKLREKMGVQFRTEFFNLFNTPSFGRPENRFGNPLFGQATQMLGRSLNDFNAGGAGLNSVFQVGGPRSIQFSARLYF